MFRMRRFSFHGYLLLVALGVIGCERGQPTPCVDVVASNDIGQFELALGGLARDRENKLEWYRCSLGQRFNGSECVGEAQYEKWEDTIVIIDEVNEKSGTNWRMPTLKELRTLVIEDCGNPAVNPNVFPGILVENYWAADKSSASGFRCGMYTYLGATSCRLFNNLERPALIVRDY